MRFGQTTRPEAAPGVLLLSKLVARSAQLPPLS